MKRKGMTTSEAIAWLQTSLKENGDLPLEVTDGFMGYGVAFHAHDAGMWDSPRYIFIRPFDIETGVNTSGALGPTPYERAVA